MRSPMHDVANVTWPNGDASVESTGGSEFQRARGGHARRATKSTKMMSGYQSSASQRGKSPRAVLYHSIKTTKQTAVCLDAL